MAATAVAAVAYVLAAWLVAPGFYDGFAPAAPYRWVSPPPDLKAGNQQPSGGTATIAVRNGAADSGHLYTTDQQASVTWPAQAFAAPPGGAPLTLEIQPAATYPPLGGISPAGNVYQVTVSTRITGAVVVNLRYGSQQVGPPSDIFAAETPASSWRTLGSVNTSVPYTVSASTRTLGYFVVGFPAAAPAAPAPASSGGGPPLLLLVAAGAVALVLLGGIPLLAARRRSASDDTAPELESRKTGQGAGGGRRRRRRGRR